MKLSQHVTHAIDDASAGRFDAGLMHASAAVDATSRKLYPQIKRVRARFIRCLREYYWLIEPMLGAGINLVETKFTNVPLPKNSGPDFAEIIYEVFRCNHMHGEEVPSRFAVIPTEGAFGSVWGLGHGELHMPDRVIWALLGVSVFSKVNTTERTTGSYYLSLGDERFPLTEWWGRENDFRPVAARYNQDRVKLDKLERFVPRPG